MICAWQEYLSLLPMWMRKDVDAISGGALQELRLRIGMQPEMVMTASTAWLHKKVSHEDIKFVIQTASQYSPWAAETVSQGYITASGGHRIGVCGDAVVQNGQMSGIRSPTSLCIRVARDFPNIAAGALQLGESVLIIGRPGSGKTTLLRDLIRQYSEHRPGSVSVVDERGELFPFCKDGVCFPIGKRTDILTGCTKSTGIHAVLRTMGPSCIAVDEITEQSDCNALLHAGWCGVSLLATAHAANRNDLLCRPVYRPIISSKLFDTVLVMQADKSWRAERL